MSDISKLKDTNFHFSKKLGQNFIFDPQLLQAICSDSGLAPTDTVLEIGAGSGSLTRVLAQTAKRVVSFEIDESLQPALQENLKPFNNVSLIFKDILSQDLSVLEHQLGTSYTLVANLPYYITTPILFYFVKNAQHLEKMVVMVQKEVADRICAKAGTKDYGILSVILQAVCDVKITRFVSRNLFTPVPNVDSSVVLLTLNKTKFNIKDFAFFQTVVKQSFAMRRKTLQNNLLSAFDVTKTQIASLFQTLSLPPDIRAEALTVTQLVDLANALQQQTNTH